VSKRLDIRFFAKRLADLKSQVLNTAELSDAASKPVELDQNRVGRLSRMDALQGQAMAQASAARQTRLLKQIGEAEKRIAQGDYGLCVACDEHIASARLLADPTVQTCISCASALES